MKFLVLAVTAQVIATVQSQSVVCPGGGTTVEYKYFSCFNSTHVIATQGMCNGDGDKENEEINYYDCPFWSVNEPSLQYCHNCGTKAICSNSQNSRLACAEALSSTCNENSTEWFKETYPCVSDTEFENLYEQCVDGSSWEFPDEEDCGDMDEKNEYCDNCNNGVQICTSKSDTEKVCKPPSAAVSWGGSFLGVGGLLVVAML